MNKADVITGVAVVAVCGGITYGAKVLGLTTAIFGRKRSQITASQAIASNDIAGAGGDPSAFLSGPSIYAANSPWLFGANVGNVIPPNSAGVTLPGAVAADFLGFTTT
jgi:hypothetical protein